MLSIEKIITVQSKSNPGVTFTVRSLGKHDRAVREFDLIEIRADMAQLWSEFQSVAPPPEGQPDERTPDQKKRAGMIDLQYSLMTDRDVKPAIIRAGLVSIDGLEISGAPATAETIISGPDSLDPLFDEIYDACEHGSGLTDDQAKNSESPTISNEPTVGEDSSSTVAEPAAA